MVVKELVGFIWEPKQFALGIILAAAFLFLNFAIAGFSLAVPVLPQSSTPGQYAVSAVAMPVIEEIIFRVVVPSILLFGLTRLGFKSRGLSFAINVVLSSVIFAGFHFAVYTAGGYAAKTSPFIAAFLFGVVAMLVTYNLKKQNILTVIIFHAAVNAVLLTTFAII